MSDKEAYELSLTENVQRETLDPVDEAEAYKRYVNDFGWGSVSELARKIGKSQEYVSHRLLLLRLPSRILESVRGGQLTPWQAQELVWLQDSSLAAELSHSIAKHKLTVRQIRNIRRNIRNGRVLVDALNEEINSRRHMRIGGLVEFFEVKCLDRCIRSLEKAASDLSEAINGASAYQNQVLRTSLAEKRPIVQRLIDDLSEVRQNYRKVYRQQSNPHGN